MMPIYDCLKDPANFETDIKLPNNVMVIVFIGNLNETLNVNIILNVF